MPYIDVNECEGLKALVVLVSSDFAQSPLQFDLAVQ